MKTKVSSALRTERTTQLRPGKAAIHSVHGHRVQTNEEPEIVEDVLNVWLEQPLDARWMAAFRLVRGGTGRLRVGEVRIFPIEPGGAAPGGEWSGSWLGIEADAPRRGLTKQVLNRARPHLWLQEAEKRLPIKLRQLFESQPPETDSAPKSDTRGRPRMPDAELARVAELYVSACEKKSPRPVEDVARRLGESVGRVRGWIHKARKRDLLSNRGQGESGGTLTKHAEKILRQQKRNPKNNKKERKS